MTRPRYETPEEAEAAFYRCFERGDAGQMMAVWEQSDDIVCIHPFGQRLEGVAAVEQGWGGILSGRQRLQFRVESALSYTDDQLVVHAVLEHIRVIGDDTAHMPIIATNIYRLGDDGWRMILHHSSPQPKPEEAGETEKAGEKPPEESRTLH
jgi:ketosteroid isomerase-like protein